MLFRPFVARIFLQDLPLSHDFESPTSIRNPLMDFHPAAVEVFNNDPNRLQHKYRVELRYRLK